MFMYLRREKKTPKNPTFVITYSCKLGGCLLWLFMDRCRSCENEGASPPVPVKPSGVPADVFSLCCRLLSAARPVQTSFRTLQMSASESWGTDGAGAGAPGGGGYRGPHPSGRARCVHGPHRCGVASESGDKLFFGKRGPPFPSSILPPPLIFSPSLSPSLPPSPAGSPATPQHR